MEDPGELAARLVQKHMPKLGTLRKSCTYKEMTDDTYDTSNGNATDVSVATFPGIMIVFAAFNFTKTLAGIMQNDEKVILDIDKKAIFPSLDLSIAPKVNDQIVAPDGVIWRVMGIGGDPKPAIHTLHVRPLDQTP